MSMLYDHNVLCDLCHRPSRFGFLYKCHQDIYIDKAIQKYQQEFPDPRAAQASPTGQLRAINMSASVIAQFEQGDVYTQNQIDLLKLQKSHMLDILEQHKARLPMIPKCSLKCCPTCRPYLKDRVPYSFDAVFANEIEPVQLEKERLPIKNANIMLELGLRPIPPLLPIRTLSAGTSVTDDDDDISLSNDDEDDDDEGNEGGEEARADIDGSDGAAVTEESVETAIPDIVKV
jgi:hypothetical protein